MSQVLIIEDDPAIRNNLAETLELAGYTVLIAENGNVGVQIARNNLPDLIICDVTMPEMDGFGVLLMLREQPTTMGIPFIFLTANADRESVRYGMDSGADDYLIKPFTTEELLTSVTARLVKWKAIDRLYQQSFDELRLNLITMLPHELRTPLVGILAYGDLMRLDYDTLDTDDIRQMGEVITTQGKRLQRIIENYFLYTQIEMARYDSAAREAFMIGQVEMPSGFIGEVALATATIFERANDLFIDAEDAVIRISPKSLWKILEELVGNAFKFSSSGTVVEIKAGGDSSIYKIQIRDHGRGMLPEQVKQIGPYMQFERKFYEQQGMGMGLVLAKRLIELCDGVLGIVSKPGHGTTIAVELPLAN